MAHGQGHSVDEYLETIYFLAFPIGEYRPAAGSIPGGAPTPTSATTPRVALRPRRTETTAPLTVPSGTSYVNGRERARVDTSG